MSIAAVAIAKRLCKSGSSSILAWAQYIWAELQQEWLNRRNSCLYISNDWSLFTSVLSPMGTGLARWKKQEMFRLQDPLSKVLLQPYKLPAFLKKG